MTSRILVINDDKSILELFRLILHAEAGYDVVLSLSAFEDITEVEHIQPDLIILDFKMGQYHAGWSLLQKLNMYRPTKDIPLILCTAALSEVHQQEEILRQRGIPVIYKPFSVDDLLQVVHDLLSSSK
jgi:CheY-like chemotaxis protein